MYQHFLIKHVKRGDKIPAKVIDKFFSFFTVEKDRLNQELKSQIKTIKVKTINKFVNDKEYNFSEKLPSRLQLNNLFNPQDNSITESVCSLHKLIGHLFNAIILKEFDRTDKGTFIRFIYDQIDSYFNLFKCDGLAIFGKYKRYVLTGFIIHKFGFQLSKDIKELQREEPTNQMLREAVRYPIENPKNEKSK